MRTIKFRLKKQKGLAFGTYKISNQSIGYT